MNECIMPYIRNVKCFIPNANPDFLRSFYDKDAFDDNFELKHLVEYFIYTDNGLSTSLDLLKNLDSERVFISTTGPMSAFFFRGKYVKGKNYVTGDLIARRVKEVFCENFDVKVIVSIRRQSGWIPSAYAEWHRYFSMINGYHNLDNFVSHFKDMNSPFYRGLDYMNVVESFEDVLGKDNVYVAVYEQLSNDFTGYYKGLLEFIGGDLDDAVLQSRPSRNVRHRLDHSKKIDPLTLFDKLHSYKVRWFPNLSFKLIKRMPVLIKAMSYVRLPIGGGDGDKIMLSDSESRELDDLYESSNRKLSDKYALSLEKYGYFR